MKKIQFRKLSRKIDYLYFIKHALFLFFCLVLNNLQKTAYPYSTALLVAVILNGGSNILCPLLYLLANFICGGVGVLPSVAIPSVFFLILPFILSPRKREYSYIYLALTGITLIGFIFLSNGDPTLSMERRIFIVLFSTLLSFLFHFAIKAVANKGLKFKLSYLEIVCLSVSVVCLGMGISNFISPLCYKTIIILLILLASYFYKGGTCCLISAVLSVSMAIYYNDLNFISSIILWGVSASVLMPVSRYLSAFGIVLTDYLLQVIFGIYSPFSLAQIIFDVVGAVIFIICPTSLLKRIKDKLYSFREKQLVRSAINRNRTIISNRLYELSGIFLEMAESLNNIKSQRVSEDFSKVKIFNEIASSVCASCPTRERCSAMGKPERAEIIKLIDIAFAKGKLSLIDISPKTFEYCFHPNNILFCINKNLEKYRNSIIEEDTDSKGRQLVSDQARGVSEILRGLAIEEGKLLKYQSKLERKLSENLFKMGISLSEMMIYGDEDDLSVSLIVEIKDYSLNSIISAIKRTVGINMYLEEKTDISEQKCFLSFKKASPYDAVFGIAGDKKDGSDESGDTHAVTRINGEKFLVALSDGMGSGKQARDISSSSLSLIESFYKAGLPSSLILNTVNKLLAVSNEDSFTALDVSVIDLQQGTADFIKYGSPYAFIIGNDGIKIIEGNSLPLGIVDELQPSVCHAQLNSGDTLLLLTDGVSDAFGSSSDLIDYLKTIPAKNPQNLADNVLSKAIELSGKEKKDDMTALAVRVFGTAQTKEAV